MKKFIHKVLVLFMSSIIILMLSSCDSEPVEINEGWEGAYVNVLLDAALAPDQQVIDSRLHDIEAVYSDDTLSIEEKVALMMKYSTLNETKALRYSYFNNTQGTTELSSNSGTLIYQRTRKQNLNAKYDTTLKLPVNHNFDVLAKQFVTDSTIRLVVDGKYYRMSGDDSILSEQGILASSNWKKVRNKFNVDEDMIHSQNYEDAQKSAINYDYPSIINEGATIEIVESENGNYYRLTYSVDIDVANTDTITIDKLCQDNGGSNMSYNSFSAVVEIWTSGFFKSYKADESWQGKMQIYNGSAVSRIVIFYSYSDRDNNMDEGIAIKNSL